MNEKQKQFIQLQLGLCSGHAVNRQLPPLYADSLLGLTETASALDRTGNRDFQHNPLFWAGVYLEPIINQWLQETEKEDNSTEANISQVEPLWPEGKKFAVCLTHDVDQVTLYSWPAYVRMFKRSFKVFPQRGAEIKNNFFLASRLLACVWGNLSRQRALKGYFEPWLALEAQYGFRSTFFFFPDRASHYHEQDGVNYSHQDFIEFQGQRLTVAELMREIDRQGWEVGLHGTYHSFDDTDELKRQKEQVESSLQKEITSIRQHCLHYDMAKTPRAQSEAGFKYDSTLGSNRIIGFRNGIAFPFYHYDLIADTPLPLMQIPLHIQDCALLSPDCLDLTPPLALLHAQEIVDKVAATQGLVTILWHPDKCNESRFPGWFWVYQELLRYIARKDAWVAPVREIGQWWESRRQEIQRRL